MTVGLFTNPKCDECGKFMSLTGGASSAMIFDFAGMCPDHEAARCAKCTALFGPVQSNAKPADGDMSPYQGVHP